MTINIRKLELSDYYKGYPELMQSYFKVNKKISFENFCKFVMNLNSNHQIYIIEFKNKVIGTYSLLIENKLFYKVGYLNDLIISEKYRNKGLGIYLVSLANYKAEKEGCKKILVNCKDSLVSFFKRNWYETKEEIRMDKLF